MLQSTDVLSSVRVDAGPLCQPRARDPLAAGLVARMWSEILVFVESESPERPGGLPSPRDPAPRASRPVFKAAYNLRILVKYENAPNGENGAVLRREGFLSNLMEWSGSVIRPCWGQLQDSRLADSSPSDARLPTGSRSRCGTSRRMPCSPTISSVSTASCVRPLVMRCGRGSASDHRRRCSQRHRA